MSVLLLASAAAAPTLAPPLFSARAGPGRSASQLEASRRLTWGHCTSTSTAAELAGWLQQRLLQQAWRVS